MPAQQLTAFRQTQVKHPMLAVMLGHIHLCSTSRMPGREYIRFYLLCKQHAPSQPCMSACVSTQCLGRSVNTAASLRTACRQHYLHERNLKEMAALQSQLSRAVTQRPPASQPGLQGSSQPSSISSQAGSSTLEALPAPSAFTVHELRKAVAGGWIDQVCLQLLATSWCTAFLSAVACTLSNDFNHQLLMS